MEVVVAKTTEVVDVVNDFLEASNIPLEINRLHRSVNEKSVTTHS